MDQTLSLATALQTASWHHLFALARAHGLRVSNRWAKDDLVATLHTHLTHPNTFPPILTRLPPSVHDALRTLVRAQGRLPLTAFTRQFGQIHPYRPWRKDARSTPKPWEQPVTPADHLWFLGLCFAHPGRPSPGQIIYASLPQEILGQIVPLFDQTTASPVAYPLPRPGQPADFLWHLAIFLASAAPASPKLRNQRWLLPSDLAVLAARLGLDQTPAFNLSRSERAMPYLAFLHYVAECNQLIAHGPTLGLTPLAWQWLDSPTQVRWQQIWQALIHSAPTLAAPFRFAWPALSPQAWSLLSTGLGRLSTQAYLPVLDFIADLRSRDPYALLGHQETDEPLVQLVRGPLHWLGLIDLGEQPIPPQPAALTPPLPPSLSVHALPPSATDNQDDLGELFDRDPDFPDLPGSAPSAAAGYLVRLTPLGAWLAQVDGWGVPDFHEPQPAHILHRDPDTLHLDAATHPLHLARLAAYADWQPPDFPAQAQRLTLAAQKVGLAVANGAPLAQIFQDLHQALAHPPSRRQIQLLKAWATAAQQVQLRQVTLLETDSAALMGRLRSRRPVRRYLGAPLSPTRSEVNPSDLEALRHALEAQDLYIPNQMPPAPASPQSAGLQQISPAQGPGAGLSPLLLTAALILNGLAAHVELPMRLPPDLHQDLADTLSVPQRQAANLHARTVLDQIEAAISGYLRLPAWRLEAADTQVYPRIKQALEAGEELTILYWNADSGQPIQRRITPYYIETRRDIRYLHAWCHLRQDERIFRLDRIERIVGEE